MTKVSKSEIKHWQTSSERDLALSQKLFKDKVYNYSLFFVQLANEKLLKGIYTAKTGTSAPYTHDLAKLAMKNELTLPLKELEDLTEMTTFHISARYEDFKQKFYKKANKEYAQIWLEKGVQFYKKFCKELKNYE